MADRKRKAEDGPRFIHGVTPIKTSKKGHKYFNAIIQTEREEYHHTVAYHIGRHEQFSLAEKRQTPIMLRNASKIPSKYMYNIVLELYTNSYTLLISYPLTNFKYDQIYRFKWINLRCLV